MGFIMPRIADRFRGFLPIVVDVETGGFNADTDALLGLAAAQEAYYLDALSYSGDLGAAPPDGLGFEGTEKGWYRVTVETDGPDRYRLLASPGPGSPQVLDEDCREFWIDQTGARGSSPEPASVCWR